MAKSSGLGQQFFIGGRDISGDVGSIARFSTPRGTKDITGIDKSAMERIYTRSDTNLDWNCFFNDAANQEHVALSGLATTDQNILWMMGTTRGDPAAMVVAKQLNYDGSHDTEGFTEFSVNVEGSGVAAEWGITLTAGKETHSSAGSTASIDNGASSSNGAAAMLHIVDINSGAPTVKVEHSANDSSWSDLIAFTAVSDGAEPATERKTSSGTVNRYLRITTTGTFSNAAIAVAIRRGESTDATAY